MLTRLTDGNKAVPLNILIGAICFARLVLSLPSVALTQPIDSVMPPDPGYPDGVSSTHVYAKIDLLDRSLDRLIDARNVPVPSYPRQIESGMRKPR